MIISENIKPSIEEFKTLMNKTDTILNEDAKNRETYYTRRSGKLIEADVYNAMIEASLNTSFYGTISLISGFSFPDIIANKYYGVEVKSTEKNNWTSIGSSILESTRNANVERIYLTFGKLGKPVKFMSRPYEECMSGIAVTHYPRYQIDMRLKSGETIFDKMKISYDELRKLDNPVLPVSQYYKSQLKPGESLWWTSDNINTAIPPKVRLWTALTSAEKQSLITEGYVLFPEIISKTSNSKYNRYSLWLATVKGIVNNNIRDSFSAGGKILLKINDSENRVPAAFGRLVQYKDCIINTLLNENETTLKEYWNSDFIEQNRISQWIKLISIAADNTIGRTTAIEILNSIFLN